MRFPLRVSVELPTYAVDKPSEFLLTPAIGEIASAIEEAGFDGCHVTDHPAGDARWLSAGGHHALDPFVALSFAAAATSRLRLLTYIYVAAYRNPFLSAKTVASLDVLSGGRVTLGVAAGYLKPEFGALGVDFDERNELLEEAIEVMKLAWTSDEVSFEGRHFRSRAVTMRPRPLSQPHPPVWMGGNSYRAIRRAVETCQGWVPFPSAQNAPTTRTAVVTGVADLAPRIRYAHEYAAQIERSTPLDICFASTLKPESRDDPGHARDELQQLAEAGVTWTTLKFPTETRADFIGAVRRYGEAVLEELP